MLSIELPRAAATGCHTQSPSSMSLLDPHLGTSQESVFESPNSTPSWVAMGRQRVAIVDATLNAGGASAHLLKRLDEEMAQASLVLLDLTARRNVCCPFLWLPVEITAIIVTLVADIEPAMPFNAISTEIGWIKLTHICRRLRDIVLDMSTLWAKHVCHFPVARQTMLERARNSPLDVSFDESEEAASFALLHAGRARSLTIRYQTLPDEWRRIFSSQSMPFLETLIVDSALWATAAPPLVAPNVHTIQFYDSFVPWTSSNLRVLTISLTISLTIFMDFPPRSLPSPSQLLSLLMSSPNIEELELRNCFPDMSPVLEGGDLHLISLPKLAKIEIENTLACCFSFWRCLSTPRTGVEVLIQIQELGGGDIDMDAGLVLPFFQLLAADLCDTGSSRHTIRQMSFINNTFWSDSDTVAFTLHIDDGDTTNDASVKPSTPPSRAVKIQFEPEHEASRCDAFGKALLAFPLKGVETTSINLEVGVDYTLKQWQDMLTHLEDVRNLHIMAPGEHLIRALTVPSLSPTDSPTSSFLPSLNHLHVCDMATSLDQCGFEDFKEMLSTRKNAGIGIRHLQVDDLNMNIYETDAQSDLRELCSTLDWREVVDWEFDEVY